MKVFTAMKVTESGPVSLDDPYTAFTLPRLNSGSIFDGDYGFVKSGIWRVTEELGAINDELEVTTHLSSKVLEVDTVHGNLTYERNGSEHRKDFDFLIFGTDPLTACRLVGNEDQVAQTQAQRFRGTSGKLNLMFKDQVRWKHNSKDAGSDAAFRLSVLRINPKCQVASNARYLRGFLPYITVVKAADPGQASYFRVR